MSLTADITFESQNFNNQINNLCSTVSIESEITDFLDVNTIKKSILSKCYSIISSLKKYHVIPREYFDFIEISDMIEEVFDDSYKYLTEANLIFLNIVVKDFTNIMKKRYSLTKANSINIKDIDAKSFKEYNMEFDEYHKKFRKYRRDFHNILIPYNGDGELTTDFIYELISNSLFND